MSLIRWTGGMDPFQDMEEMVKQFNNGMMPLPRSFVPALDMYETKDAVVVEMPLPGIDPKHVEVTVEKGIVTVQGSSQKEHEVEEKNYYRKEVRSGTFFRQAALPVPVKEDKVNAEFSDGMLRITAPKTAPTQAKKIDVKIVKKENGKKSIYNK